MVVGMTSLFTGEQVSKADPVMNALGQIDHLNSALGMALAHIADTGDHGDIAWKLETVRFDR